MLFNSWIFVVFFIAFLSLFSFLRAGKQRNGFLLISSYIFYGAWDYRFLSLLLFSTCLDYWIGARLHQATRPQSRRFWLMLSCVSNLAVLGFFKYFNFFLDSLDALIAPFGLTSSGLHLNIVLPVGISFYTFQTMSYTIDIYRKKLEPCKNFLVYAVYVSYFPQLVAGPIERATNLLPQIAKPAKVTSQKLNEAVWLISFGLFKKIVVADTLARQVDRVFSSSGPYLALETLLATYAFAIQIYCDFSGYSDIARGISKLLGIELMVNFKAPYLARNPSEFWRRWHISLSTWLRDYLYIPLGGNRKSPLRTYRNLMLTMLLGGLWHGAAWTFVAWGAIHGSYLAIHRFLSSRVTLAPTKFGDFLGWFVTFHVVCVAWMFFRADSFSSVVQMLGSLVTLSSYQFSENSAVTLVYILMWGSAIWIFDLIYESIENYEIPSEALLRPLCLFCWLSILVMAPSSNKSFIYFQF